MLHKHKCENPHCGLIWEHEVPDTTGMAPAQATKFYDAGHMCPQCHTGPYKERYFANRQERENFSRKAIFELLEKFLDDDEDEETDDVSVQVFRL